MVLYLATACIIINKQKLHIVRVSYLSLAIAIASGGFFSGKAALKCKFSTHTVKSIDHQFRTLLNLMSIGMGDHLKH